MKKTLITLLVICLTLFGAAGCSKGDHKESTEDPTKLKVVTTMFPSYDFAKSVFGEKATVSLLLPPGSEAHSYEPSPQDIKMIEDSDLFIYNGGENEKWVDKVLGSIENKNFTVLAMTEQVDLLDEEVVEGMEDETHHHKKEIDEHVWTSPKNAIKIATAIEEAGAEIKPEHEEYFTHNLSGYVDKLEVLDNDFQNAINGGTRKVLIFADKFPIRYFVEEYGLEYYAAFPGCSTDTEASAATVSFLIDKINKEKIPVVLHIEMSNQKMAKTIAAETGAEILEFHSCHNLTKEEFDEGMTYLSLMGKNLEVVRQALK